MTIDIEGILKNLDFSKGSDFNSTEFNWFEGRLYVSRNCEVRLRCSTESIYEFMQGIC